MHRITSAVLIWLEVKSCFGDWRPKAKRAPLCSTAQPDYKEPKQHLLGRGVNISLSDDEATQVVRYRGGGPLTSTRAGLLGRAGPSSGISRDDGTFHLCCFQVSKQF